MANRNISAAGITWPPDLTPGCAQVHVHNELLIAAPAEACFAWLCRGPLWPTWYSSCGWFKFDASDDSDLATGSSFSWQTFQGPVHSTVRRFEPPRHLEWDTAAFGIRAYHAWLLVPQGSHCQIVTEESQVGLVPFFLRWYFNSILERDQRTWLEGLRAVTERSLRPVDLSGLP